MKMGFIDKKKKTIFMQDLFPFMKERNLGSLNLKKSNIKEILFLLIKERNRTSVNCVTLIHL